MHSFSYQCRWLSCITSLNSIRCVNNLFLILYLCCPQAPQSVEIHLDPLLNLSPFYLLFVYVNRYFCGSLL